MKAFEVQVGDKLQPRAFGYGLQTVKEIYIDETGMDAQIILDTDQGSWLFRGNEDLLFPRRRKGETKLWTTKEKILIQELFVGDIVPGELGWVYNEDGEPELRKAHLITAIVFSNHGTYLNLYSPISKKTRRLYVPLGQRYLHGEGCVWEDYGNKSKASAASKNPNRVPTTSGRYINLETAEVTIFRIAGRAGRPPLDSLPAPTTHEEWEQWSLLDKSFPHPEDPREWKTDAIES